MRRNLHVILLVFAALSMLFATGARAYDVVSGHPRLFFRAADVPALRAKCSGAFAQDYNEMRSYCDSHMGDSLPLSSYEAEWHLGAYSFVWLISQNTTYAARAKAIAQSVLSSGNTDSESWLRGGALFFDWCYDYLSPTERQSFGQALASGGDSYIDSQNWSMISCFHGHFSRLRNLIYPGLAIYGEGISDAKARELCDLWREQTYGADRILCCMDELAWDGSWFQGEYSYSGYLYQSRGFELWATATNENPYEDCDNYKHLAEYYLYETGAEKSGGGLLGSKQGDTHSHGAAAGSFRLTLLKLAKRYRDGRAQWLAQEIDQVGEGYVNTFERWRLIVFTDLSVAAVPPTDMPDSWFFQGVGTVYMRSGFDLSESSDDVYAVFRCERFPDLHTHAHQNHLLVARGGDLLAVDSGAYDQSNSSHHDNYFARTIAHNTITVYDPSENTFDPFANDGGQRRPSHGTYPRNCGDLSEPQWDRGRMVAFEDSETFTYAKGDATAAYSPDKLDYFTREVVYLKPDVFVILDRVGATSSSFEKRWLLHSINQPEVSGSTAVFQEGDSKLFAQTLLPAEHSIDTVGGPGREFEVNGVNYPPNGGAPEDAGSWRIEVTPENDGREHLFLHVLYVADASVSSMPETKLVESEDVVGVEVNGRVVMFTRTGIAIDSASYDY
ncbi:MAG: hypothetical protein GF400_01815 [Candidatus Eisenbacteria bacterium]|nr:hypothetical protein [Candidatus Eisenbacteria bacterium]